MSGTGLRATLRTMEETPHTLVQFLLARIAEDERGSWSFHEVSPRLGRRWDAQVAARRTIVEHHQHSGNPANADRRFPGNGLFCMVCMNKDDRWCLTLRAVASVYADHPDYREEWKP